jgi:hypothetical protein
MKTGIQVTVSSQAYSKAIRRLKVIYYSFKWIILVTVIVRITAEEH